MTPYGTPNDEQNMVHIRLDNDANPEQFWVARESLTTFNVRKLENGYHGNYTIHLQFNNAGDVINYCFDNKNYITELLDRAEELGLTYGPHFLMSENYNF